MEKGQGKQAWEVTSENVETAIRKIIEISQPLKLILFGSYVRGDTDINSDLDIREALMNGRVVYESQ